MMFIKIVMEVKKSKKILKEVEEIVSIHYLCDKCKNEILNDRFDAFEFDFELRTGESFPEFGNGERYNVDINQHCTLDLIELMKKNGINVQKQNGNVDENERIRLIKVFIVN